MGQEKVIISWSQAKPFMGLIGFAQKGLYYSMWDGQSALWGPQLNEVMVYHAGSQPKVQRLFEG